jgi:CRP/FNR family transcriptional regulator, anaerobic regulatory protein
MRREEIASYLGMKNETLSRIISKMISDGVIDANRRNIKILNMELLHSAGKRCAKSEVIKTTNKQEVDHA